MLFGVSFHELAGFGALVLLIQFIFWLGHRAPVNEQGWCRLVPSPGLWIALVLGSGFVLTLVYWRLSVGPSFSKPGDEIDILGLMIGASTIGMAICSWSFVRIHRHGFEWRGSTLVWRKSNGVRKARSMDDLVWVHRTRFGSWMILSFADGETVKLSESARGIAELAESIGHRRPDLLAEAPQDCRPQ